MTELGTHMASEFNRVERELAEVAIECAVTAERLAERDLELAEARNGIKLALEYLADDLDLRETPIKAVLQALVADVSHSSQNWQGLSRTMDTDQPTSVAEFVRSDPATRERVGAEIAARTDAAMDQPSAVEKLALGPEGAWTCSGCGQRNSGWATTCGRCELPITADNPADQPTEAALCPSGHALVRQRGDQNAWCPKCGWFPEPTTTVKSSATAP